MRLLKKDVGFVELRGFKQMVNRQFGFQSRSHQTQRTFFVFLGFTTFPLSCNDELRYKSPSESVEILENARDIYHVIGHRAAIRVLGVAIRRYRGGGSARNFWCHGSRRAPTGGLTWLAHPVRKRDGWGALGDDTSQARLLLVSVMWATRSRNQLVLFKFEL